MSNLHDEAIEFAKKNKKKLVDTFCSKDKYPPVANPFTLFMAGPPGAGKTEHSKGFISQHAELYPEAKIVRLDVDEIRAELPMYDGKNSDDVQSACTLIFEKIYDKVQKQKQNAVVDITFASSKSFDNVKRALGRGRQVGILYIYQEPEAAWRYTQMREKVEGRHVPLEVFVDAFVESLKNVEAVKQEYGSEIELDLVIQDGHNRAMKQYFNVAQLRSYVQKHVKKTYTQQELMKLLAKKGIISL